MKGGSMATGNKPGFHRLRLSWLAFGLVVAALAVSAVWGLMNNSLIDFVLDRVMQMLEKGEFDNARASLESLCKILVKARSQTVGKENNSGEDESQSRFPSQEGAARYFLSVAMFQQLLFSKAEEFSTAEAQGKRYIPPQELIVPIVREIELGLDASQEDKRLWRLKGIIENMQGKFMRAAESLEKAVQIDPKFGPAYNNLGRVYMNMRKFEKAEAQFKAALLAGDAAGDDTVVSDARYNLGIYYSMLAYRYAHDSRETPDSNRMKLAKQNKLTASKYLKEYLADSPGGKDAEAAKKALAELE
jgi:tetratricopeptide (TPR) repeat protein